MLTPHIVFLDRDSLLAELRPPAFAHRWTNFAETAPALTAARLAEADIVVTNKVRIDAGVLDQAPRLKLVAVAATGVNNIDLDACRARGLPVCNIRGYAEHTVPEHVFMLLLALRRNLLAWRQTLLGGAWQKAEQFCLFDHEMHDLHGATLGLIGVGNTGEGVLRLAEAFGMTVLKAEHKGANVIRAGYKAFDEVLARADQISLHVPLVENTRHLISTREFGLMKPTALLINCARGGVVDETALLQALDEGRIAGAATDVLGTEPPRAGHPLLERNQPNLIVTPHVAWSGREAMQRLADQLIDNIERFVAGQPRNLVT